MTTRRREPLPEDAETGTRPGHPVVGREVLTCTEAAGADWLRTTTQTVRTLIEHGELDGYWQRTGAVYQFRVYRDAAEQFLALFGPFPAARRRRAAGRRPASTIAAHSQHHDDITRLNLQVMGLQETVRCQSTVIQKLRAAMTEQEIAADHLRHADSARSRAAKLVGEANDEYQRLVSLAGIPDDPSNAARPSGE